MLLIDGIKYQEWEISNECELEKIVIEHAQDIFSDNSIYFDKKQKLKSLAGVGSVPDGLAIVFGNSQQWHIVEVELSSHDPYQHVIPQVDKFINAVDNQNTRNKIVEALYSTTVNDWALAYKIRQALKLDKDIHKFLSDLISRPPTITIIIEKNTEQLREALKKYTQKRVVEFQTFVREGAGLAVHAHLFEPLYKPVISIKPEFPPPKSSENSLEVTLQPSYIESYCIYIPAAKKYLFPTSNTTLKLDTDIGLIEAGFNIDSWGIWLSKGLSKWFKAHPELKAGDNLRIAVIEPMKKYHLEAVR